ncbi:hypothetical protein CYMTET_41952 [Cymbomonas tetramitiformis]|uniref:Uncharacterized protein n=1 Tax=Cymbomonas tetramitiformis TaxID=36881 RepID=A0AAE0C6D7_9CHLO|nr:hypothetical protein CYMTET_41952 [Cymbomonas tetramitiformis]
MRGTVLSGANASGRRAEASHYPAGSEEAQGAWRVAGANSEIIEWIAHGTKMRWLRAPPPQFDHGVSLLDATPLQQTWLDKDIKRALGTEA